jgi:hypothetical protein
MLINFRNYDRLELSFDSNLVLFIGRNGQGKTNILESVFLCSTGRSHRTSRDKELIKWQTEGALVRTGVEKSVGDSKIEIQLRKSDKKRILINAVTIARLGELMGHLNSVMFSPEDMKLVKEGPVERRRFMDMELSQIRPKYFYYLQQYNRILNHRNNLLKEIVRRAAKSAKNKGICISIGRHPPKGFTPCFWYRSIVFLFLFSGSFLYFSLISFSIGCNSFIFWLALLDLRSKGIMTSLISIVNNTMANP